jgi:hypothetical protein
MHEFHGGCHCGNLVIDYTTPTAAADNSVRACQCSYCRKHDARSVSNPTGRLAITVHDETLLERYRFGLRVSKYLICRKCGVYVSAYMARGDEAYANVLVSALDARELFPEPAPLVLDGEYENGKWQRRRRQWTPATLRIQAP